MVIQFKDGYLKNIEHNHYKYSGCETCDYGSEYVDNIVLYFSRFYADFDVVKEYDYAISLSDIILIFTQNIEDIRNMTEVGFVRWFYRQIRNILKKRRNEYVNFRINFNLYKYNK